MNTNIEKGNGNSNGIYGKKNSLKAFV